MKHRGARLVAWTACGLTLALIVAAAILAVLNDYDLGRASFLIAEASAAVIGAVISARQPRNPVGWLILGHAFCFSLGEFGRQYTIYGVRTAPGSLPAAEVMVWPTYWVWFPGIVLMFLLLPLYFPDGRLVSPRWRWVAWLSTAFLVVTTITGMFRPGDDEAAGIPNPLGVEAELTEPFFALSASLIPSVLLFLGVAAAASLVVRYRRSADEERQQIKWVVLAAVFLILDTALNRLFFAYIPPLVSDLLFLAALEGMWVAIAVAILRHRLYDIDVIINRTLVYGALTATLALVYLGSVVLLQYAFRAAGRRRIAARHRRLDAPDRGAVQPFAAPGTGTGGPALLPRQVRRGEDAGVLLGQAARRDGPGRPGRGPGRRGGGDRAARPRLAVAPESEEEGMTDG